MICVNPADCTDFSTNGNGTLAPLSAEVTETLNGEYELTLVHPIDEAGKWQRLVEGCILRAPVPAAMTPRVNFTAPGDDNRTEVWRVNTDFSLSFCLFRLKTFCRFIYTMFHVKHFTVFCVPVHQDIQEEQKCPQEKRRKCGRPVRYWPDGISSVSVWLPSSSCLLLRNSDLPGSAALLFS